MEVILCPLIILNLCLLIIVLRRRDWILYLPDRLIKKGQFLSGPWSAILLLDHIEEVTFGCNIHGRIFAINKYGSEEFGLNIGDTLPAKWFSTDKIREMIKIGRRSRAFKPIEFKVEGDRILLIRMRLPDAEDECIYGIIRDITNEEKSRYYKDLYLKQSSLVFLGSIFESIAHELRTPCLAAAACFRMIQEDILNKLDRGEQLGKNEIELLQRYVKNGARTTDQISDLLNHSRSFRIGYRKTDISEVDLLESITYCKEALESAYNTILAGHIEVEVLGSGPFLIRGSMNRFMEALGNIIKNSVEAVIIRSRYEQDLCPKIQILLKSEDLIDHDEIERILTIEVQDNGIGIEDGYEEQIGRALFSTKSSDREFKGTGLGLTLAIQTLNSMGATWEISNRYNNEGSKDGTKTTIKFPIPNIIRMGTSSS